MWTSMLDLDPKRVLVTQLLMRIWPRACFSSFAPLQVRNLPRQPLPEKTWVRVRNRLAGICGSDLHMVQADGDFRIAPAATPLHARSYPGHEVVGEVLEIGEDVQHIRVGDRVALQYSPNCLSTGVESPCRSCAQGYYNLCSYGNLPGPHPIGGGWSEEMLLPEQQLFRLPASINDEQAVLLEPTAVAIHAVLRRLPQGDERVLIIGAGTIGLLTLQIVRSLAPQAEVSVLARHPFQIEQATRLGATHIIYPQDSYTNIQQATGAQLYKGAFGNQMLFGGYDVIFDTVGSQKTLHHALRWARAQATVVLVGVNLHMMHIDLTPVWYQEVNLIGSLGSSIEIWPPATHERRATFDVAAELIKHEQIHPEHLITHRFPLNNYQAAILTAADKLQSHAIKVVFDYSLLPPSVVPNVRASAARKQRLLPTDERTPVSDDQATPEGIPSSTHPTEPAIPASLSTLFSSSHTVVPSQQQDDEFDEMEDTLQAPAIAKHIEHASANQVQREHFSMTEEDIAMLPMVPAMSPSPAAFSADVEATPSTPIEDTFSEDDIYPELETETSSSEFTDHRDEPAETTENSASEAMTDVTQPAYKATVTPTELRQDSDELFQPPSIPIPETIASSSEIQTDEATETALEPVATDQDVSKHTEHYATEVSPEYSENSEELETQQSTLEPVESSTLATQDVLPPSNSNVEEKIVTGDATGDTENTLLDTEGTPTVKVLNRSRSRNRKKSNRTSR